MLFLRLSSILLAAVSCHARSVPRGIPGGNVFDQVRFLNCKDGLITAYYDAPPSYTGPPTYATRWGKPVDGWNKGSTSSGTDSNGKKWEWDLRKYTKYVDPSKKYIGNVTYQGEGFNCFGDDGHQVHVDRKYGQCYTTAFCIHHEATIINFSASTDAVSWAAHTTSPVAPPDFPDPQGAVNGIMAKVRKAKTGPMTCDSSSISIGNGCSMLVTCESSDVTGEALTGLIDTMVNTYASDSTLFKPINTGSCHGPAMTSCDYYRGVSIPARYHLATANVAPPEGDGSLPRPASSGLKATLSVVISCKANERNPFLCSMLRAATVVGGATIGGFPGGMFGGYGMLVIGSCG